MKLTKKTFVSALLALAMVITCFLSFGATDAAAAESEDPPTIFYVNDYYPTLSESFLTETVLEGKVAYYRSVITNSLLSGLAAPSYWNGVEIECFVLDLKRFQADADVLYQLFMEMQRLGAKTVLVTCDETSSFSNLDFMDYVDLHYISDFSRVENYVDLTLDDFNTVLQENDDTWQNINILIDGYLVDVNTTGTIDKDALCQASPFLRILLDELGKRFYGPSYVIQDYDTFVAALLQTYNIRLLVCTGLDQFVDISWGVTYTDNPDPSTLPFNHDVQVPAEYTFAMGFWSLTTEYYNFLKAQQDNDFDLPVYVLEADPIVLLENGLAICSDYEERVAVQDVMVISDEVNEFLSELSDLLES